jgi:hypothetical protein
MVDTTRPVVTLLGDNPMVLEVGTPFSEPGKAATDNYDGDITGSVVVTGIVDHTTLGTYVLRYNVSDSSANPAEEKTRKVNVTDTTPPMITLLGDNPMTLEVGTPYTDGGYKATDNYDDDVTDEVTVTGSVNEAATGTYILLYNVSDSSGNAAPEVSRTVNVVDITPVEVLDITEPFAGLVQITWSSRPGDAFLVWSCSTDLVSGEWVKETTVSSQGETTTWIDPAATSAVKVYIIQRE